MAGDQPLDAEAAAFRPVAPHVVVLFGVTGDLAKRKLLPGLMHLCEAGLMPDFRLVGATRRDLSDEELREMAREACEEFGRVEVTPENWGPFAERIVHANTKQGAGALADAVAKCEKELGGEPRRLHYLSVPPTAALPTVHLIDEAGVVDRSRIIMEKPFGTDLASACELNAKLHQVFDEHQIFRIDHYLGKEAAQNILALRFANGLFEPIWNLNHIDHVQIDVPETHTVADRGGFYEETGAFRDMVVTHLFQILAFVAMEPPTALDPESITVEKNKVFRSLRPLEPARVVRGQYEGYSGHDGVPDDTDTETLVALRCEVDNWRWAGVPFYLRTGKRMAEGWRIISIAFREPPKSMFPRGSGVGTYGPDHLTFDLDDAARLSLSFYGKRPGPGMLLDKQSLQFSLAEAGQAGDTLEAYERLIRDAMIGDHTLFTTADGIERLWEVSEPLLSDPPRSQLYRQESWGPEPQIPELIEPYRWRLPFERRWRDSV
ncbi:MAG: glucose-6-phosphate dehydrogenase [Solirubrobacterales bacterium]|nr:glucose-6-phosphate dehydrogenase [Solirubrobacterales bacterium]